MGDTDPQAAKRSANEAELKKQEYEQKIKDMSIEMDKNAACLARIIQKNANPNPSVVVGSVIVVVGILYLIYIFGFKPNASGEWYDDQNTQWIIEHDVWSDQTSLVVNRKRAGRGVITDNMFKFNNIIGVWNYHDVILLVGGGSLTRVIG